MTGGAGGTSSSSMFSSTELVETSSVDSSCSDSDTFASSEGDPKKEASTESTSSSPVGSRTVAYRGEVTDGQRIMVSSGIYAVNGQLVRVR